MSTPSLYLQTAFILNNNGRIISTREPDARGGPAFLLVRSTTMSAWAVRVDLPQNLNHELDNLARQEPPVLNFRGAPLYADRYVALVGGKIESGPAFIFPDTLDRSTDIMFIDDLRLLSRNFREWTTGEIPERSPISAILHEEHAVSVCFCARRSEVAAEAGLETAAAFRGHGFGPRVTAAWALAIRASKRIPLYSTSWKNEASLAVACKLGLIAYASIWSLSG